ncbi:MAG: DUF5711 family protein [Suipraeoptans sp.]
MFKGKKNFRVIDDDEEIEINIDEVEKDIETQIKTHKRKRRIIISIVMTVLIIVTVGTGLFIHYQTYTTVRDIEKYDSDSEDNSSYIKFLNGVLKYSKDGVSLVSNDGKETWNSPYEMKNPIVAISAKSVAVGDKGANQILVFDKNGIKGEIKTTSPIEKINISEQGIVCAVLSNDNDPEIVCYDASGNILVQHSASFSNSGYPVDAEISSDGKTLMVSYLNIGNESITSKVNYYNFAGEEDNNKEISIVDKEYKNTIVPTVFFMGNNISVHVGDNQMSIIRGSEKLDEVANITFDNEILSVVNSDKLIGIVEKDKTDYRLYLYDVRGKEVLNKKFSTEYSHIKLVGNEVIMYDGTKCCIITRDGVIRFEGDTQRNILEIYPVIGINKYIVVSETGIESVRLTK